MPLPPCWSNPGSFANLDSRSKELFNFERRGCSSSTTAAAPAVVKFTMIWPNFKPQDPTSRFWSTTVFVHNLVPYYAHHPHLPTPTAPPPLSATTTTAAPPTKNPSQSSSTISTSSSSATVVSSDANVPPSPSPPPVATTRRSSRAMYATDISISQRFFGYIMLPQDRSTPPEETDDSSPFSAHQYFQSLYRFGGMIARSADFMRRHVLEKQMNIESLFDVSRFTVKAGAQYFFSPHLSYNMQLRLGESPRTRKMIASTSHMLDFRTEALCCNALIDPEKISLSGVYRMTWEDRALFGALNMLNNPKNHYRSYIDLGTELAGTRTFDSGNVSGGIRFVTKVNGDRRPRTPRKGSAPLLPIVDREIAQHEYVFVLGGDVLGHFFTSVTYLSEALGLNWSTKYQLNTTNGYSTVGSVVEWRPKMWSAKDFVLRFMISNYTGTHASITKQHVSGTSSPPANGHSNGNGHGPSDQASAASSSSAAAGAASVLSMSPTSVPHATHPVQFRPISPDFEIALGTEFRIGNAWHASLSLSTPTLAVVRLDKLKWGIELVYGGV